MLKFDRTIRKANAGEDGSALILALVALTVISIALASMLSFTTANFKTVGVIRGERQVVYTADGTADAATQKMRVNANIGANMPYGTSCDSDFTGANQLNGSDAHVSCAIQSDSGIPVCSPTCVTPTAANTPQYALFARDPAGSGINFRFNDNLIVNGPVVSNSAIGTSSSGVIQIANGNLTAHSCDSGVVFDPGTGIPPYVKNCAAATTIPEPGIADHSYDLPVLPGTFALQSVPAGCNNTGSTTAILNPGYYNDAAALSNNTCGSMFFNPGVYYFRFTQGPTNWGVTGQTVIGGEANGWDPNTQAAPGVSAAHRCKTDAEGVGPGVEFVFGGASTMSIDGNTDLEICAPRSATAQEIAFYGVPSGHSEILPDDLSAVATKHPQLAGSSLSATGWGASSISNALAIESPGNPTPPAANWSGTSTKAPAFSATGSATVKLPSNVVPAGSIIDTLQLKVAHRESANVTFVSVSGVGGDTTPLNSTNCAANITRNAAYHTDVCGLGGVLNTDAKINNASLTFSVAIPVPGSATAAGTADLDGIELSVSYFTPGHYALQSTAGDLFNAASKSELKIRGTVYAPNGDFTLDTKNQGGQEVDRGLIAASLESQGHPNASFTNTISIPTFGAVGATLPRHVILNVFIPPGAATPKLTVELTIADYNGAVISVGQSPKTTKWKVLR